MRTRTRRCYGSGVSATSGLGLGALRMPPAERRRPPFRPSVPRTPTVPSRLRQRRRYNWMRPSPRAWRGARGSAFTAASRMAPPGRGVACQWSGAAALVDKGRRQLGRGLGA
eukprot:5851470-Alexandrium_andersonii.AAC.1